MKQNISDLRSTIRRLRPFLLFSEESSPPPTPHFFTATTTTGIDTTATTTTIATASNSNNVASSPLGNKGCVEAKNENHDALFELQKESIAELVETLASFVYELDLFWTEVEKVDDNDQEEDDEVDNRKSSDGNYTGTMSLATKVVAGRNIASRNGHSERIEESKSLVHEGYGLLLASTTTSNTLLYHRNPMGEDKHYDDDDEEEGDNQNDSMTCLVRNSILDLLPSMNTSPCRHLLLSFLPNFMPSASSPHSSSSSGWQHHIIIPPWLQDEDEDNDDEKYSHSISTTPHHPLEQQSESNGIENHDIVLRGSQKNNNNLLLVHKLLEVFQTLIQTDISTLAPLLAILSTLFGQSINNSWTENNDNDESDIDQDNGATASDMARTECFHLCLSSMSSVSEHDLPSLLNSLLALVWTMDEGRLVMDTVRREWTFICRTIKDDHEDIMGNDKQVSDRVDKEPTIVKDNNNIHHVNSSLVFVGVVIIQFIQSEQMPGSKYVAQGFLHSLKSSLHETNTTHLSSKAAKDGTEMQAQLPSIHITSLDVILMIALHSHEKYQHMVETIIDSMTHHQTFAFFELLSSLIQTWMPSGVSDSGSRRWSEKERTDSILYDTLASPLISTLFYVMMSSSTFLPSSSLLMGGILPYCSASTSFSSAADANGFLCSATTISSACCRVLSRLYSSVDPNRQETIINSLLSMVSDSFVFSASLDVARKRHRSRYKHNEQSSNSNTVRDAQNNHGMLLEAARSACRTLLIISNNNGLNTRNIRGTVLDRLLLLASKSVLKTNVAEKLSADNDTMTYYHLFDMNCALVISLLRVSDEEGDSNWSHADSNESSDLLILCQKLLFSSSTVSTATSNSSNSYQHRAICGVILASRLLRCKLIPNSERGNIWSWIITVISPSSSAATPLDALDPEIARWGLVLLKFAASVIPTEKSIFESTGAPNVRCTNFPEIDRFVETQPVCGQGDVFNQVNKMLATAGIIQWEDMLKVPLFLAESQNANPHTFLAFLDISMRDQLNKQKSPTGNSMVICGPHFLHGRLSQPEFLYKSIANHNSNKKQFLESIDLVADYVYHLIDRYLELGTLKSANWNPRGWLLAKTQLPCCLSESAMEILGMKRNYGLELYDHPEKISEGVVRHRVAADDDFHKQWRLLFADEIRTKVTVVQNLVEFVYSVVISISVSSAALKHAYQHFQQSEMRISSQFDSESNSHEIKSTQRKKRKQTEALRKLLQFQVCKILTLQKICKNIHLALSGLHSEVRKENPTQQTNQRMWGEHPKRYSCHNSLTEETNMNNSRHCETKAIYERKRIPWCDIKSIIIEIDVFMSSKANFLDDAILWTCLDDDIDDDALVEAIRKLNPRESAQEGNPSLFASAPMIFHRRICILQCLLHNMLQINSKTFPSETTRCQPNSVSHRDISRLFRMMISLTDVYVIKVCREHEKVLHGNDIGTFLSTHFKLLLAIFSNATKDTPTKLEFQCNVFRRERSRHPSESASGGGSSSISWFKDIMESCAKICDANFTASQMSETSSSSHPNSWETLSKTFATYLNDCKDISISCHIIDLVSILYINSECSYGTLAKITKGSLYSVYTTSAGKVKNPPYTLIKLNSILLEASINKEECFDSDRDSLVNDSVTNLIQASKMLMKAKDSFTSAFVHHILAHWSALILDGTSQIKFHTEMVESLEIFFNRRSTQHINSYPRKLKILAGLNEKSHSSLFEILLLMNNASLSLSKPRRVKKRTSPDNFAGTSPYGEIIGFMEIYCRLLSMFQTNRINFPTSFIRTIVRSSSNIVKISEYQLRQCVQWRNSQTSRIGTVDFAAAELLQPLVDGVASHCIGGIISFCNTMKVQQNGRKRTVDSSYQHTRAIAGLQYRCEGIIETLRGICQSQNLDLPKDFTLMHDTTMITKLSDVDNPVAKKKQRTRGELSPQKTIRIRGSINKAPNSPSVLELLPETDVTMDMLDASIALQFNVQSDSEDSDRCNVESEIDNDSMEESDASDDGDDDDDSFGVIGNWLL